MYENWKSIDDLARHLTAELKPGDRFEVDPRIYDRLSFERDRYELACDALSDALEGGETAWAQGTEVDYGRTVIYRLAA